jgi:uncharacterized membrane protein
MDEFRQKLINRTWLLTMGTILALSVTMQFFTQLSTGHYAHSDSNVGLFHTLIVVILFISLISSILRNVISISSPNRLKKRFIFETDERSIFIKQRVGPLGMNIIMFTLAIAATIAGNFSGPIFYTLLFTLLFVMLLRGVLILYFRHKY